jgi:hypothetical protein
VTPDPGRRFVCSDPSVGDLAFPDVAAVLDAVEAGLVAADTPLFDAARQSWQPLACHPEIRAAWVERARFRPPGSDPLALPRLPEMEDSGETSAEDDEVARRRRAYALVRGRERAGFLSVEESRPKRPRLTAVGVAWALLILLAVGWALVTFAVRLYSIAVSGSAGPPAGR